MIKSKQLARVLFELSEEKTENLNKKFLNFIKKGNLKAQLPSVLYHLEKIIERDRGKKGIQIEIAHEIRSDTVKRIKTFLETCLPAGRAVSLPEIIKIRKELIGGFRAKWGGMIYDSSIMTSLKKLQKTIIK